MRRPSPFARVRARPCVSGLGVASVRPVAGTPPSGPRPIPGHGHRVVGTAKQHARGSAGFGRPVGWGSYVPRMHYTHSMQESNTSSGAGSTWGRTPVSSSTR